MAHLTGGERARYVQGMFARIADRYDKMNRLMTFGQDVRWRREVICRAALPPRARLLDLGTGTGDLAIEALHQQPDCQPIAVDFTLQMMRVGQSRPSAQSPHWAAGDALLLPPVTVRVLASVWHRNWRQTVLLVEERSLP